VRSDIGGQTRPARAAIRAKRSGVDIPRKDAAMKFLQQIQKRIRGILLLGMLVIPFLLYAAARSGSLTQVYFYLVLLTIGMLAAMRYA